ncbi:phage tail termination protein [Comamonas terrae]|uniref:Uncharacterized protein n=1 Tax=Comamonas terrae TaxID=673548 RepID=A0ABW5UTX8_9BURK|nr:hypothetical protein [Comamonas terrae]
MNPVQELRQLLLPVLGGWRFQFGRWTDGGKSDRYAVLRPMGGPGGSLVRRPAFSLMLIGSGIDAATVADDKAQEVIALLANESGSLVFAQPGEPVYWATDDGRAVAELPINTIINR